MATVDAILRIAARVAGVETESKIRHEGVKKFNLAEFKNLKTTAEMVEYAYDRLEPVGSGSSRKVFILTSRKALKIAASSMMRDDKAGIAQNKEEVRFFENPSVRPVVAAVFDHDPEFRWIVSELVRPIEEESEFKSLTDCDWDQIVNAISVMQYPDVDLDVLRSELSNYEEQSGTITDEMMQTLLDLEGAGLGSSDLKVLDHWGKTTMGRVVLLDSGFSTEVQEEFYS